MIEVKHLVKWYGPTRAVNGVSFAIPKGQIVGFLGPNGAGKTTTIRMLTGYLPPTSGTASIAGHDILAQSAAARAAVGYLPENNPLYPEMRVEEYLQFRGRLHGMERSLRRSRINLVCERCGLDKVRRRVIGQLSKGNRQRVGLAQALLHDPPVLILDEPTSGFDPNQISQVRDLISELRGHHTILLSSHILPEIERTADRVIIIAAGSVVAQGTPDELRQQVSVGAKLVIELLAPADDVTKTLGGVEAVRQVSTTSVDGWTRALVTPADGADPREAIARAVASRSWPVREMYREGASLEKFFVQITAAQDQRGETHDPNDTQDQAA